MDEAGNSVEPEALTALTGLIGSKGKLGVDLYRGDTNTKHISY